MVLASNKVLGASKRLFEEGQLREVVHVLNQRGFCISDDTFRCLLRRCTGFGCPELCRELHCLIMEAGGTSYISLGSFLIRMYASCESLRDANQVFVKLPNPNIYAWAAIISAHSKFGQDKQAINLYNLMLLSNVNPDGHVFVTILKACANTDNLAQGRLIHSHITKIKYASNFFIGSSLIDMYSKCENLLDAQKVFDSLPEKNLVTWSALISGYAYSGQGSDAIQVFLKMQDEGIEPDNVTLVSVIKACSEVGDLDQSMLFHSYIIESALETHVKVGNAVIDMYCKCVSLKDARGIFDRLPNRNVVTWSTIIAGYTQNEQGEEALSIFEGMQLDPGVEPNPVTFNCLLRSCSSLAALDQGRLIHGLIIRSLYSPNVFLQNALVELYAKCGHFEDALKVLLEIPVADLVTWNTMIAGYAQKSDFKAAIHLYVDMQEKGLKPNTLTILSLLVACSQVGLVHEGCNIFMSMRDDHHIAPEFDHYSCMIDIFGRAGFLKAAEDLLQTMPSDPHMELWMCLLSHCKLHGNVDVGHHCFDCIVAGDYKHSSSYVLMLNTYFAAGMWKDAERVQELKFSANAWNKPGGARIELDKELYEFVTGDKTHSQNACIYAKLNSLMVRVKGRGFCHDFAASGSWSLQVNG